MRLSIFTLAFLFMAGSVVMAKGELTPEQKKGKEFYDKLCVGCHGEQGKGDGAAAEFLRPKPRNFKGARYKFTWTQFGKLPQDATLFKWIAEGLPGTSMPGWKDKMSDTDIHNMVAYLKTFSKKFARAVKKKRLPQPIEIGSPPQWMADDIKKGNDLFQKNCEKCHGKEGRGSGPSAVALAHDFGDRIWPRNLTKGWLFRGGNAPQDIYRTIATGITGTPMPAHLSLDPNEKSAMTPDEVWAVVGFVDSIVRRQRPKIKEVVVSKYVGGDLPKDATDTRWKELEPRYLPMVSQIIEGERWFTTTIESVYVRSTYNDSEIAILVEWDDPSNSPLAKPVEKFPENKPDAIAIQLPPEIPTGMEKPYFLGGSEDSSVVLWKWTNGEGAVTLEGKGILKTEKMPDEGQLVTANAVYEEGRWKVVFTRPLKSAADSDLTFKIGKNIPIAFSAWDGNNGEKNEKRVVSIWYWLVLEPPKTMMVYLFPAMIGLLVAAGEMVLVKKTKNNYRGKSHEENN